MTEHKNNAPEADPVEALYDTLRAIAAARMRFERGGHTLDATGVVHEAYLRLHGTSLDQCEDPNHFLSIAAATIRRVLVDHARGRERDKRGGGRRALTLHSGMPDTSNPEIDVLELHDALSRLGEHDASLAQIVELRFFGGLSIEQVADVLGVSASTANRRWRGARAWLRREMGVVETRTDERGTGDGVG
jgi:RNA polymerase sigma factor (TIGR02999 family)